MVVSGAVGGGGGVCCLGDRVLMFGIEGGWTVDGGGVWGGRSDKSNNILRKRDLLAGEQPEATLSGPPRKRKIHRDLCFSMDREGKRLEVMRHNASGPWGWQV